jgi:hypothetical protein
MLIQICLKYRVNEMMTLSATDLILFAVFRTYSFQMPISHWKLSLRKSLKGTSSTLIKQLKP